MKTAKYWNEISVNVSQFQKGGEPCATNHNDQVSSRLLLHTRITTETLIVASKALPTFDPEAVQIAWEKISWNVSRIIKYGWARGMAGG